MGDKYVLLNEVKGRTMSVQTYDCNEYVVKVRTFDGDFIPKTTTFYPKNPVLPKAEVQDGSCLVFFQSGSYFGYRVSELISGLTELQEIIPYFCGDDVLKKTKT